MRHAPGKFWEFISACNLLLRVFLTCRNSFEDQTPRQDETPRSAMRLPRRPSLPGAPETPVGQPALRPNYQSSTKLASSTGTPSEHILSDSSSPAPSRVPFRCLTFLLSTPSHQCFNKEITYTSTQIEADDSSADGIMMSVLRHVPHA